LSSGGAGIVSPVENVQNLIVSLVRQRNAARVNVLLRKS
jgi:hypothetical protein